MKKIFITVLCLLALCLLTLTKAFALPEPVDAIVTLSQSQLKAGDTLHLTASIRNLSDSEITVKFFAPYLSTPEIINMITGKSADILARPIDRPAQPAMFILKPHETHDIISYTIETSEDPKEKILANDTQWNRGLLKAVPGLYSVKFSLSFASISGTSSKVIVTHMENFTIVTEKSLKDCARKAAVIKIGMTRAEIESLMGHDGGESGIYKGERLFFNDLKSNKTASNEWTKQLCMLNIDFRPYGLSDSIYHDVNRFNEWVRSNGWHPDPKDRAIKLSNPFIDYQHYD